MIYGFLVKAADGVSTELLEWFEILSAPVIVRGSTTRSDVARQFVLAVTEITGKLYKLYKTTITAIVWSRCEEDETCVARHSLQQILVISITYLK
jgi:hypothetical protein